MKKSTILMYLFWLLMISISIFDILVFGNKSNPAYDISTIIITTFVMYYWFVTDASELNITPSVGLKISVICVSIIALPYYLFKYKGFKNTLIAFSKVIGFIIISLAAIYIIG